MQIADWARQQFQEEVNSGVEGNTLNLAKACMLIALEEEAAEAAYRSSASQSSSEQYHRVFFPAKLSRCGVLALCREQHKPDNYVGCAPD